MPASAIFHHIRLCTKAEMLYEMFCWRTFFVYAGVFLSVVTHLFRVSQNDDAAVLRTLNRTCLTMAGRQAP